MKRENVLLVSIFGTSMLDAQCKWNLGVGLYSLILINRYNLETL